MHSTQDTYKIRATTQWHSFVGDTHWQFCVLSKTVLTDVMQHNQHRIEQK